MKNIIRAVHENRGQDVKTGISAVLNEKVREVLAIEKIKIGLTYLQPMSESEAGQ